MMFQCFLRRSLLLIFYAIGVLKISLSDAQIVQTHRYESEVKFNDEPISVISLNDEGIALLQQKNKFDGSKRMWQATILDTTLREKHIIEFKVDERYPLTGYEVISDHLYLLYRTGETVKHNLLLVDLNTEGGWEVDRFEIKPEVDIKLTHFNVVGSTAIFGGYVSNDPALLLYDMPSKNLKMVPGFFQKDTELVEVTVNQNRTFNIILVDRSLRSERKLLFRVFDVTGKLLLEDTVPIDDDVSLQTTMSSSLQREDLMVLGTWSAKNSRQSAGLFTLPVDPFTDQKINYYHFGQLEHFVDYLPEKRAKRIKENTKTDLQEGRRPSFVSYSIPYKISEGKFGYILLTEVYNAIQTMSPYYSTPYSNPYYTNPYFNSSPFWPIYYPGLRYRPPGYYQNAKNTERVKTFASSVAAFDGSGELLWDHSIKLDDIEKEGMEQVTDYYFNGSELTLLYRKESDLKAKVISVDDGVIKEVTQKIKPNNDLEEIRNERENEGGVEYWNANSFFTWGYHTIRNRNIKGDRARDVFYINKVVVP